MNKRVGNTSGYIVGIGESVAGLYSSRDLSRTLHYWYVTEDACTDSVYCVITNIRGLLEYGG